MAEKKNPKSSPNAEKREDPQAGHWTQKLFRVRSVVVILLLAIAASQVWKDMPALLESVSSFLESLDGNGDTSKGPPAFKYQLPNLIDASVEDLAVALIGRQTNSVNLVKAYTARIREVNDALHAVIEINPDALAIAKKLDKERRNAKVRGALHGVPILIKDNIATLDKMNTTAGSYALVGARPPDDATVVRKLREAGAIILGKTNLSGWSNSRCDNSSHGWSAVGGQCSGVYHPNQDPLGSSSGSGVAASLGLALAALGTETSGSIVLPAENSNVVGIKPTVGLTSRHLVIPISARKDTVGPMAKTVKDAAYLLRAIAGVDGADNYTLASPYVGGELPNYVHACKPGGLVGKRIGVPRNLISVDEPVKEAFDAAVETIRSLGATVVEDANIPKSAVEKTKENVESLFKVVSADILTDLPGNYLSQLTTNPHNITSLDQLREFTRNDPREKWPERDTGRWDKSLALGFDNTSPEYWKLHQKSLEAGGSQGILGVLKDHDLDAVILPTSNSYFQAAYVATPIVQVPMGFYPDDTEIAYSPPRNDLVKKAPGVPFGLSFLGPAWSEADLISFAYAYEQATMTRRKGQPYITPKTDLREFGRF